MFKILPKLINDIFIISSLTFIVYLGLELLFEGLISNYFDLHILLVVVLVLGIVSVVLRKRVNVVK